MAYIQGQVRIARESKGLTQADLGSRIEGEGKEDSTAHNQDDEESGLALGMGYLLMSRLAPRVDAAVLDRLQRI